jgi:hypothetical protein
VSARSPIETAITSAMLCMTPDSVVSFVTSPQYAAWKESDRGTEAATALIAQLEVVFAMQARAASAAIADVRRALPKEGSAP